MICHKFTTRLVVCGLLTSCCLVPTCFAQKGGKGESAGAVAEYVFVTAPTGYLEIETGKGTDIDQLPTWTPLMVTGNSKTHFEVTTPAREHGSIRRELVQPNPLQNATEKDLIAVKSAAILLSKSNRQTEDEDYTGALRSSREALRIIERDIGRYNQLCPWVMLHLAFSEFTIDDVKGAMETLAKAEAILDKLKAEGPCRADVENVRAILLARSGDMRSAVVAYEKGIELAKQFGGEQHSDVRVITLNFARLYAETGNFKEALRLQEIVCGIGEAILPPFTEEHAVETFFRGYYLKESGRAIEAVPYMQESLAMFRRLHGEKHPDTITILEKLAEIPAAMREKVVAKNLSFDPAKETLCVIGNHAYIRDESGVILRTLSRQDPVTFIRERGERYEVRFRKTQGWVRKSQLVPYPTYQLEQYASEDREKVLEARLLYQDAMAFLESELDVDRAAALLNRARELTTDIGDSAMLSGIVRELGYLNASRGDFGQANIDLRLATRLLGESRHANNPILNAELENAKGHTAFGEGNFTQAVTHYSKSLSTIRGAVGDKNTGTASLYGNLGQAYAYSGDLKKAKPLMEKQIAGMSVAYGVDTNEMSIAYLSYADLLVGLKEYTQAREYGRQALEIRQQLLGDEDIQTAGAHSDLGYLLWMCGSTSEAEQQMLRALEICDSLDDRKTIGTEIATRRLLVQMLKEANKPIEALAHAGPLLEQLKASKQGTTDEIATLEGTIKQLAAATNRQPATANQMLVVLRDSPIKDGNRVMMTVPPGTHLWSLKMQDGWHRVMVGDETRQPGWIHSKNVTSVEAQRFAEIDQAGDMLEKQQMVLRLQQVADDPLFSKENPTREELVRALRILDDMSVQVSNVGGDNFVMASIRKMIAGIYLNFGEFGEARKHLESALATHIEHLGHQHPETASDRIRLGELLASIGDHVGAEREFRKTVRLIQNATGPDSQSTSGARAVLGNHLINTGSIEEGRAMLIQVLTTEENAGRSDQLTVLRPLTSLSLCAFKDHDMELAFERLHRAREVFANYKDQIPNFDTGIALQMQLGVMQLRSGDGDAAIENLSAALDNADRDLGTGHAMTSTIASYLGYANAVLGRDLNTADRLSKRGLAIASEVAGPEHIKVVEPLIGLSAVTYHRGDLRKTLALLERIRVITNKYVREVLVELPAQSQFRFLESNDRAIRDASLSLVLKHADDQQVIDQTARWILNSKGLAVETAAARGALQNLLKSESSQDRFKKWQDLRRRISTFPLEGNNDRVREARKGELRKMREQEIQLRTTIAPGFADEVLRQQHGMVSVAAVREKIPADSVLIEFLRLKPTDLARIISPDERQAERYVAWIVPPVDDGEVRFIDFGEADRIDDFVAAAQAAILNSPPIIKEDGPIEATKLVRAAMQPLHTQLWQPLQEVIGHKTKVIISPDANLWLIPWAAIPIADEKFLAEDVEIRLVNSGRNLVNKASNENRNRSVIIADPAFNSDAREVEDTIRLLELDTNRTRSIAFNGSFGKVKQLPGTRAEAESIETSLEAADNAAPEVFLDTKAAEAVFRSLDGPRTLMVGTHGFVLDENQSKDPNPLARCGLLLAGYNDALTADGTAAEDGVLTGLEIVETDLRGTRLVVLSACQTGLGAIQDGEGVAGLRQAFQLAGAGSVVATLWEISDDATVPLIIALFDGLALRKSKPAALREAQVKRIRQLRNREGAAHPFFWAAFTLTGQE